MFPSWAPARARRFWAPAVLFPGPAARTISRPSSETRQQARSRLQQRAARRIAPHVSSELPPDADPSNARTFTQIIPSRALAALLAPFLRVFVGKGRGAGLAAKTGCS